VVVQDLTLGHALLLLFVVNSRMVASGGLDGKVVFYLGGQDLHQSVPMRN
jgi:hypothetical protein